MKNTDTREVIMISIRLSTKNLQTDYYPFILEPEARHLFLKELASHFAARRPANRKLHVCSHVATPDFYHSRYMQCLRQKSAVVSQLVCLYRNGCQSFPPYPPFHLRHDPTHHSMDRPSC